MTRLQHMTQNTTLSLISLFFFFFGLLFFGFRDRILLYNLDWLGTQDQAILLPQAPQVLELQVHATKPIFFVSFSSHSGIYSLSHPIGNINFVPNCNFIR